jgi:hypothetical protein
MAIDAAIQTSFLLSQIFRKAIFIFSLFFSINHNSIIGFYYDMLLINLNRSILPNPS